MIEGEFKRLRTEGGKGLSSKNNKKPQGTDGNAPETAGTKSPISHSLTGQGRLPRRSGKSENRGAGRGNLLGFITRE
jgi:hypothetical protein